MNSIYEGSFIVTQAQTKTHHGMDLVGISSKNIMSNVNGKIERLGYESLQNPQAGFGLRIWILDEYDKHVVFGHLSYINEALKVGDVVKRGDFIGIEGSTGKSTGSHCHYEVRSSIGIIDGSISASQYLDIENIAGRKYEKQDTKISEAIKILNAANIIDSPDFWEKNYDKVIALKHIGTLIIKMAIKISEMTKK